MILTIPGIEGKMCEAREAVERPLLDGGCCRGDIAADEDVAEVGKLPQVRHDDFQLVSTKVSTLFDCVAAVSAPLAASPQVLSVNPAKRYQIPCDLLNKLFRQADKRTQLQLHKSQ